MRKKLDIQVMYSTHMCKKQDNTINVQINAYNVSTAFYIHSLVSTSEHHPKVRRSSIVAAFGVQSHVIAVVSQADREASHQ